MNVGTDRRTHDSVRGNAETSTPRQLVELLLEELDADSGPHDLFWEPMLRAWEERVLRGINRGF